MKGIIKDIYVENKKNNGFLLYTRSVHSRGTNVIERKILGYFIVDTFC